VNQHYLKTDSPESLAPHLEWQLRALGLDPVQGPAAAGVVIALRDRVKTLKEMAERARVWYEPLAQYDEQAVAKHFGGRAREALAAVQGELEPLSGAQWRPEQIDAAIKRAAERLGEGVGKVAQPLRVAITGTAVSPSIDHTVFLTGHAEALRRIERALARMS
jgi:glutamyl-tRNA synthetase